MELTVKIPLQEKIAELESRIEALERESDFHFGTATQTQGADFGTNWQRMWERFDAMFKRLDRMFR